MLTANNKLEMNQISALNLFRMSSVFDCVSYKVVDSSSSQRRCVSVMSGGWNYAEPGPDLPAHVF